MKLQDSVTFNRDGKLGRKFYTAKLRRRMNKKLRDENIAIAENRGRGELKDNNAKGENLGLVSSQIRKKLRRKHGKKKR